MLHTKLCKKKDWISQHRRHELCGIYIRTVNRRVQLVDCRNRTRARYLVTAIRFNRSVTAVSDKTMHYLALTSMYPELDRNGKVPTFDDLLVKSMSRGQRKNVVRILKRTIPVTEQFMKKEKAHEKAQMHKELRVARQDTHINGHK